MVDYAKIPAAATLEVRPFKAHVSEEQLQHFKKLLELSPVAPAVFENTNAGTKFGITKAWLENVKQVWLNEFDWRKHEERINSFPNFMASVKDSHGNTTDIHFVALFSEKPGAVPVNFIHGYPGSFCEFLDILELLKQKYSPSELPYHVIVPSMPGYAYSSGPPLDSDYELPMAADALHNLMVGLGFGSGYLAHGGDLGGFVSRIQALSYDACKGMHVNTLPPPSNSTKPRDKLEEKVMKMAHDFLDRRNAFNFVQGTQTATLGHVLSASPLALLSWIGEKMVDWADEELPLDKILEGVTLYWFTNTMPRCLYHSRGMGAVEGETPKIATYSRTLGGEFHDLPYVGKPCGYSLFAKELTPVPRSWAAESFNLVHFNEHDGGGHFAAMEKPKELLADFEAYVKEAWKDLA